MKSKTYIGIVIPIFILCFIEIVSFYLCHILEPATYSDTGGGYESYYYYICVQSGYVVMSIYFFSISYLKSCNLTRFISILYSIYSFVGLLYAIFVFENRIYMLIVFALCISVISAVSLYLIMYKLWNYLSCLRAKK